MKELDTVTQAMFVASTSVQVHSENVYVGFCSHVAISYTDKFNQVTDFNEISWEDILF